jgi:hypothetical protein
MSIPGVGSCGLFYCLGGGAMAVKGDVEPKLRLQLRGQAISNLQELSRRHGWKRCEVVERLIEVALATEVGPRYLGSPITVGAEETEHVSA